MQRRFNNKMAERPLSSCIRKALFAGAALGLAMTLGMPAAMAEDSNDDFATVTPYNRSPSCRW
jgi:hypothetical protein